MSGEISCSAFFSRIRFGNRCLLFLIFSFIFHFALIIILILCFSKSISKFLLVVFSISEFQFDIMFTWSCHPSFFDLTRLWHVLELAVLSDFYFYFEFTTCCPFCREEFLSKLLPVSFFFLHLFFVSFCWLR